jgi:trk system potassium uptake protein TrkA
MYVIVVEGQDRLAPGRATARRGPASLRRRRPRETWCEAAAGAARGRGGAGGRADPDVLERAVRGRTWSRRSPATEDNLVIATLSRFEFSVRRVIARVNNPRNAWLFTPEMGVDVFINQADLMAKLIAEEMSLGDMMTLVKLRRGEVSLVERRIEAGAPAAGKAVRELELPAGCTLAAIIRAGAVLAPRGETRLLPDDEVIAVVRTARPRRSRGCCGVLAARRAGRSRGPGQGRGVWGVRRAAPPQRRNKPTPQIIAAPRPSIPREDTRRTVRLGLACGQ